MNAMPWLRRALRSAALRGTLALLLLFAQHGALTHALAHVGGGIETLAASQHEGCDHDHGPHGHDHAPVTGTQCAFDLLYSELLGGALLVEAFSSSIRDATAAATPVFHSTASLTALPYSSRGPPFRA